MDAIEKQLRAYYEAESVARLRPARPEHRRQLCDTFARRLRSEGRSRVLDVGAGPASDHGPFDTHGIDYVGVDLAFGNSALAAELGHHVVPASLFHLPFAAGVFPAGWSMSTFQHIPDDGIDAAFAEFVRVVDADAPVVIGLWGGRGEVVEPAVSNTGIELPRHFAVRSPARIRSIVDRHLVVESHDTFAAGSAGWDYHVIHARSPD